MLSISTAQRPSAYSRGARRFALCGLHQLQPEDGSYTSLPLYGVVILQVAGTWRSAALLWGRWQRSRRCCGAPGPCCRGCCLTVRRPSTSSTRAQWTLQVECRPCAYSAHVGRRTCCLPTIITFKMKRCFSMRIFPVLQRMLRMPCCELVPEQRCRSASFLTPLQPATTM